MDQIDTLIIGAGVIGLATAREMAMRGHEVVVVEAQNAIGTGISSRNSEVIHAGIYYPKDSLKTRFCIDGNKRLYDYAESHGVPHQRLGKLIVANGEAQCARLNDIHTAAKANGVDDLRPLTKAEVGKMEPALQAEAALLSPSTGIIDVHALMLAYRGDAEDAGAMIALSSPVTSITMADDGQGLEVTTSGANGMTVRCTRLVNAAGLGAWGVARTIQGLDETTVPPHHMAKGNYFTLTGRAPFSHLIYPVPQAAGLGVHLTLDLGGQGKFGPDVEWVESETYAVDPARADSFYRAIRTYWPELADGALSPGYAGIRPKIQAPGEPAHDFVIHGAGDHGVKGLVNLYGIESPGLTASLPIARHVADLLA